MNQDENLPNIVIHDRYRLIKLLGKGGMGIAFVAKDELTNGICVLKLIKPGANADKQLRNSLLQEMKALQVIWSEFVVRLSSVSLLANEPYSNSQQKSSLRYPWLYKELSQEQEQIMLVLEYCEGGNLRQRLPKNGFNIETALKYAIQVCQGMCDTQSRLPGLVHRDLKPENLLLGKDTLLQGKEEIVKIADYGLATQIYPRSLIDPKNNTYSIDELDTRFKGLVGTIPYMSPEQITGNASLDIRSDIYSYGIVLYELLTGVRPYQIQLSDILELIKSETYFPKSPDRFMDGIDKRVSNIVVRCLAKKPEERFQNWEEILDVWKQLVWPVDNDQKEIPEQGKDKIIINSHALVGVWLSNWKGLYLQIESKNEIVFTLNFDLSMALQRAENLFKTDQYVEALSIIDKALHLPSDLDAVVINIDAKKAMRSFEQQDGKMMFGDFSMIRGLVDLRARIYANMLDEAYHKQKPPEQNMIDAAIFTGQVIKRCFSDDSVLLALAAQIYFLIEEFDEAQRLLSRAEQLSPEDDFVFFVVNEFWSRRAVYFSSKGDIKNASLCLDNILERNPNDARAWYNKGAILAAHQGLAESLPYLEKAKQLGHPMAESALQNVREALGQKEVSPKKENVQHVVIALLRSETLEKVLEIASTYPFVTEPTFISFFEQVISDLPTELCEVGKQRLTWLNNISSQKTKLEQLFTIAFQVFIESNSLRELELATAKFPIMMEHGFIEAIRHYVDNNSKPEHLDILHQRIIMLQQIASTQSNKNNP